jgi:hypothetical protein
MPEQRRSGKVLFLLISLAGLLAAGLFFIIRHTQALPTGPLPIVWDREACAECRMHVGEPRFSAQLQTREGQVLNFDDPGCLLRYLKERNPSVHALYFHHLTEERWLTRAEVAFVRAEGSPMGHDLGAVALGTPSAIPFSAALSEVKR